MSKKEQFIPTFSSFVNEEAFIDPSGELGGLEFNQDEKFELDQFEYISQLKEFLEDAGASEISHKFTDGVLRISFYYGGEYYLMRLNLDNVEAMVIQYTGKNDPIEIYSGTMEELSNLILTKGLEFLMY
jgi:hypothetical protein